MRKIILFILSFLSSASMVLGQDGEYCPMPLPGEWLLEAGATTTIAGAGGGPDKSPFTMQVTDCGETLLLENFGPAETGRSKVMRRQNDGTYSYTVSYKGVPITVEMTLADENSLIGTWQFGNFASAPGVATRTGPAPLGERSPLCDCKPFNEQVRAAIRNAKDWMTVYAARQYRERPKDLPERVDWNQPAQERLITMVEVDGLAFAEAVKALGKKKAATSTNGGSDTPGTNTPDIETAQAVTDCHTCKIDVLVEPTGCGAELLRESTMAHESEHQKRCEEAENRKRKWVLGSGQPIPPSYCLIVADPVTNADLEVQAYKVELAFLRSSYKAMCGTPAPE